MSKFLKILWLITICSVFIVLAKKYIGETYDVWYYSGLIYGSILWAYSYNDNEEE